MVLSLDHATPTALWAIPVSDIAGVARHALDVAGADIPGWDLAFLCPPGPLGPALRACGARVHVAPFGPDHGVTRSLRSLRRVIRQVRPRVVHTHLSYADIVAAVGTPRGVRLVTTEHGIAADDLVYHRSGRKARVMAQVHRQRFRRVDAAIAVSQATAAAMRSKWGVTVPIRVVPNGVDPAPAGPPPRAGLRILSLARLAPEKRIPDLLRSFALLADRHPEATLAVAGVGELDASLRTLSHELRLDDQVSFPGFVDAGPALADADVVAMLSVWENCSYTLLDAAAAGLGVVASPVGSNPEMLPARCLADPDDHEAVAAALLRQGRELAERPILADWPSVAAMCATIGEVYDGDGSRA
ncbi:MAG: glycosyltransferase family 4 protein [Nocardioides sp.]